MTGRTILAIKGDTDEPNTGEKAERMSGIRVVLLVCFY